MSLAYISAALALPIFALLLGASTSQYHHGPKTDHFNGKRFLNPNGVKHKGVADVIKWQLTETKARWPKNHAHATFDTPPARVHGSDLRVSFVGHATVLVQTRGLNILTDPLWCKRASPVEWAGPKRIHYPGIKFSDLPKIDVVVISHDHYDHLNIGTLKKICKRDNPRVLVGLGVDVVIKKATSATIDVTALDWDDTVKINNDISITFMPAVHWSGRGVLDRNKSLWGAFVIATPDGPIYFGGDTAYSDHFVQAAQEFGPFRLALLPIGAYAPEWFMLSAHMNPAQAVQAHIDLKAEYTIPIHYGCFQLTNEPCNEPLELMQAAAIESKAPEEDFLVLHPGTATQVPQIVKL